MATDSEIRQWAKDRGVQVGVKGRLSDELRAEYEKARPGPVARMLPSPGQIAEDMGIIDVGDEPAPSPPSGPAGSPVLPPADPEPGEDEPPPHARREWRRPPRTKGRTRPMPSPKITAGVRGDIEGKIGFALEMTGAIWQARDPICGGVFVQQVPPLAESLTNWVVRSPQLVDWFTSPAGSGFMLLLDTGAALAPVMSAVMAHHVYHTVETGPKPEPAREQQYAA